MATPSLRIVFLIIWICLHDASAGVSDEECPEMCSCLGDNMDCADKGLDALPPDLPSWVENLILSRNKISQLNTTSLRNKLQLTTLKLNRNKLSQMPEQDFLPPHLVKLDVSYNDLTELYGNYSHLKFLDVSHNDITEIPLRTFSVVNNFLEMNVAGNDIVSITPGSLDDLTHLKHLRLSKNKLLAIPKDLFKELKALQKLDLNRNQIRTIEGLAFQGLSQLKSLRLKKNSISSLQDGAFFRLPSIQLLQLSHNNISSVSKGWLYGLHSLLELNLGHNKVTTISPGAWEFCTKLKTLDLRHNALTSVDHGMFKQLPGLKHLNLEHNKISYIEEGAFRDLKELSSLTLDYNDISWAVEDTSGIFRGLNSLVKLSLRHNHISSVASNAFVGLINLEVLDLSSNNIASLYEGSFGKLEDLDELILNTSTLLCDCKLSWFPSWIKENNIANAEGADMMCSYPETIKNRSVLALEPTDFVCSGNSPRPFFQQEPESLNTLQGKNVTLPCVARSSEQGSLEVQWKKDNIPLEDTRVVRRLQQEEDGVAMYSELLLTNISEKDAGRYQCIVENMLGKAYSPRVNITVYEYPVLTKIPSDIRIEAGGSAQLECEARGSPPPRISWTMIGLNDDFPAAKERRIHVMSPTDYQFIINKVKVEDMGVYTCTAENPAGSVSANVSLTVLEAPYFERPMENKEVVLEETVVLECSRMGSPQPQLKWRKDHQELEITERHFFTSNDQLLVIVKVKPSDAGLYECEISNPLGSQNASATLTVIPAKTAGHDIKTTTTIVVVAVVCCVIGTSFVWAFFIYQARRRAAARDARRTAMVCPEDQRPCSQTGGLFFMDNTSEHSSKDSGTGDSAKRSNDDLIMGGTLICSESLGSLHRDGSVNSLDRVVGEGLQTFQQQQPQQEWRLTCNPAHEEADALLGPHSSPAALTYSNVG